jgi:ribonucleoside-triphosphate reductase
MQNEWAGAQDFSSFDTYTPPCEDRRPYQKEGQCSASVLHLRRETPRPLGTQARSPNHARLGLPKDLADLPAIDVGKEVRIPYGECQKEMD